ncbi:hypothetical protein B0H11DRAFT_2215376 [Mycena galericulata]|nr:hypothetical protein B0H11DRAFT_2215376 [Mycena galericulata]
MDQGGCASAVTRQESSGNDFSCASLKASRRASPQPPLAGPPSISRSSPLLAASTMKAFPHHGLHAATPASSTLTTQPGEGGTSIQTATGAGLVSGSARSRRGAYRATAVCTECLYPRIAARKHLTASISTWCAQCTLGRPPYGYRPAAPSAPTLVTNDVTTLLRCAHRHPRRDRHLDSGHAHQRPCTVKDTSSFTSPAPRKRRAFGS